MADQFLSCDSNLNYAQEERHKKKESNGMISISTISASLSTDDTSMFRRRRPEQPRIFCCVPVNWLSILGVSMTCTISLAFYVYCFIQIMSREEFDKGRLIPLLSAILIIILILGAVFAYGIFAVKPKYLLPFTVLSSFLLFASIGTAIVMIVTSPNAADIKDQSAFDMIFFRIILVVIAIFIAIIMYAYIRSYLFTRRVKRYLESRP